MQVTEKISFSEKRDFGSILNITFTFLRQNFRNLGLALLYIAGPFVLLEGIITGLYQIETMNIYQNDYFSVFTGYYFLTLFTQILAYAVIISVVYNYILLYINNEFENLTLEIIWEKTKLSVLPVLLIMVAIGAIVLFGMLLLIVPGIYFMVVLSLIWIIKFVERKRFIEAMNRCIELIKGNWWKTAGLLIIGAIIQWVISFVFQLPITIAVFVQTFHNMQSDNPASIPDILLILFSIFAAFSGLFFAISLIIIAFHYFNLVEEKEMAGLITKIDNIK